MLKIIFIADNAKKLILLQTIVMLTLFKKRN